MAEDMSLAGAIAARRHALVEELQRRLGMGTGLEPNARGQFEALLGHDLAGVRLHHAPLAARLAYGWNAEALEVGGHVLGDAQQLDAQRPAGAGLLAHELVHATVQRAGAMPAVPLEEEALAQQLEVGVRAANAARSEQSAPDAEAVAERVYERLVSHIRDERERLGWQL